MDSTQIFISHSSADNRLAEGLLQVLERSLEIKPDSIRCTSVPGYELAPGVPTIAVLQRELNDSAVVIGLMTPNSMSAAWPLCELGAAWGLFKYPIPIIAGGLSYEDIGGPLRDSNALQLENRDDLLSLVDEVSRRLDLKRRRAAQGASAIDTLLARAEEAPAGNTRSEYIITRDQLKDRRHRLRWVDVQQSCTSDLYICGPTCLNIIGGRTRFIFLALLEKGANFNMLTLDPESVARSAIDFGPFCNSSSKRMLQDVNNGIRNIREFYKDIPSKQRGQLRFRVTDWLMAWSAVAIDPQKDIGRLQIEIYHYDDPYGENDPLAFRPQLIVNRESELYRGFWYSLESMWKKAKTVDLEEQAAES